MSTSLLYHGFGIKGYEYVSSHYENGNIVFRIREKKREVCCSVCGSRHVSRRGRVERRFRSLPIGKKPVWIVLSVQRVYCFACDLVRQIRLRFSDPRKSYTRAFERYALELSRHMTLQDTARHLGVSWDVIKEIQKTYLKARFSRPSLKRLKYLAIDEITIGSGHCYLTIVMDLGHGSCRLRRRRQRGRSSGDFLETPEIFQGKNQGGRHRHVASLYQGRYGTSSRCRHRFRSFPRNKTLQ